VLLTLAIGWEYWQFLAENYAPLQAGSRIVLLGWLRSRIAGLFHSLSAWRTWLGFACLMLIPSGLILFCLYAKWKVGAFKAYFMIQQYG